MYFAIGIPLSSLGAVRCAATYSDATVCVSTHNVPACIGINAYARNDDVFECIDDVAYTRSICEGPSSGMYPQVCTRHNNPTRTCTQDRLDVFSCLDQT